MPTSRRDFVRGSASLLGGAVLFTDRLPLHHLMRARPEQLGAFGVQLYTVRTLMEQSVERTLGQVAAAGYKEVEFAGYFNRTSAQLTATLKANGLSSPSCHLGMQEFRSANWAKIVESAAQVGHRWIILAWLPEADRASVDAYKGVADTLLKAGEVARKAGLRVGFHNHHMEFKKMGGTCGLDVMLDATHGTDVGFELDLYWATRAGVDPLAYFAKYPGRFPLVHVKDAGPAPKYTMSDVGKGQINFAKIFAQHAQAGIQHYYVEHDEPGDALLSIQSSAAYLRTLNF